MKQIIFIISTFIFLQATNIVAQENKADSISVEYEVCGNDTVFYKKRSIFTTTICGLKKIRRRFFF